MDSVIESNNASSDLQDIYKIQYIVVIMQENRTFDSYFGTYPGADGIPMKNGVPIVCSACMNHICLPVGVEFTAHFKYHWQNLLD